MLPDLETRVIEFLAERLVALLMPTKHVLESRSPHLAFMLIKDCWFRELYLRLKVAASADRDESFTKTIDGQIECIIPEYNFQGLHASIATTGTCLLTALWKTPAIAK